MSVNMDACERKMCLTHLKWTKNDSFWTSIFEPTLFLNTHFNTLIIDSDWLLLGYLHQKFVQSSILKYNWCKLVKNRFCNVKSLQILWIFDRKQILRPVLMSGPILYKWTDQQKSVKNRFYEFYPSALIVIPRSW